MSITILCPNGHKLVCPEQQAGKRGKCPHCGATFRVPELGTAPVSTGSGPIAAAAVAPAPHMTPAPAHQTPAQPLQPAPQPKVEEKPSATPPSAPVLAAVPIAPVVAANPIRPYEEGPGDDGDAIAFLCPNGHHLCGPTALGGQPGECPICHTKFVVPSEEELAEASVESVESEVESNASSNGSSDRRPLIELFESFWAYKEPGVTIELHLENGKVVAPDGYAAHLSRQGHGVFMVKEGNGSYTLTAITWSSIAQVAVRGVKELPEGVFD